MVENVNNGSIRINLGQTWTQLLVKHWMLIIEKNLKELSVLCEK